ncbi:MAG: beta-hexosaminidase, partial [Thomasclavelia sp.]
VLGNENAMQGEVDEVYTELVKAFLNLRLKPNKDLLEDLINKANGLNRASYTAASIKVVDEEVAKANAILNNPEATAEEVENAIKGLTKAMAGLEANPSNLDNDVNPVKPGDSTVNATKTGDDVELISTFVLGILGLIVFILVSKRAYKE